MAVIADCQKMKELPPVSKEFSFMKESQSDAQGGEGRSEYGRQFS